MPFFGPNFSQQIYFYFILRSGETVTVSKSNPFHHMKRSQNQMLCGFGTMETHVGLVYARSKHNFVRFAWLPYPSKVQQELLENFEIEEHLEWVVSRSCKYNI